MDADKKHTGIILAGGKSSRMGTDKSLILYKGKRLIEHVHDALIPYCNQILVCSADKIYNLDGVQFIEDTYPGSGPLAGLEAGLRNAANDRCIVLPCDTPFIDRYLIEQLIAYSKDAKCTVIAGDDGRPEPLIGIYDKSLWTETKRLLNEGLLKMQLFIRDIGARIMVTEHAAYIRNINKPEDLTNAN